MESFLSCLRRELALERAREGERKGTNRCFRTISVSPDLNTHRAVDKLEKDDAEVAELVGSVVRPTCKVVVVAAKEGVSAAERKRRTRGRKRSQNHSNLNLLLGVKAVPPRDSKYIVGQAIENLLSSMPLVRVWVALPGPVHRVRQGRGVTTRGSLAEVDAVCKQLSQRTPLEDARKDQILAKKKERRKKTYALHPDGLR
jgi:hypothetical protein